MSDVSVIPPAALERLAAETQLELLVLDCTFLEREISSHVNLPQALDIIRKINPRKALLTGQVDLPLHGFLSVSHLCVRCAD